MRHLTKQRGTALIVALFITALVAAAAVAMIERFRVDTRRTELIINDMKAYYYAQGSIAWAFDTLTQNYVHQQPKKLIDITPIHSPINQIEGAKITSVIYDAQGKLNLNGMNDAVYHTVFLRLLQLVDPEMKPETATQITQGVVDWITVGINNSRFDQYYAKQNPPYLAAHQPMMSVSELRLVQGMTPELYAKLLPYVTALPEKTPLNINSVPEGLLQSFSPSITPDVARAFILARKQSPIVDLSDLGNFAVVKQAPIAQNNLTVKSSYFMVRTQVVIGDQHATLYSLLVRTTRNNKPAVFMVWQSKGTL